MHSPQLETLDEHYHFWCTHHISVLSMLASTDLYLELSTACLKRTYLVSPVELTCPSMSDNCSYVPFEDNSKLSICTQQVTQSTPCLMTQSNPFILKYFVQTPQNYMGLVLSKLVHNLLCGGKFLVGVKFHGIWIFQVSQEKSRIWNSDFIRGNNFSWISFAVFESNKIGSHAVVFIELFAINFIEVH